MATLKILEYNTKDKPKNINDFVFNILNIKYKLKVNFWRIMYSNFSGYYKTSLKF